jgi:hypothetical protein
MIDPQREPLDGVVEVDQAEIPFRADNSFSIRRNLERSLSLALSR